MVKPSDILSLYGQTHSTFLHAKGKAATHLLIDHLQCKPGERIMELGFGTGGTLAMLAHKNKDVKFFGTEQSGLMYRKAIQRLKFSGLKRNVTLKMLNEQMVIPFDDNFFDKVYVESVLAIQETSDLKQLLNEFHRILKPEGILVMNETIWLRSTTSTEIDEINNLCKKEFGINQSNGTFPYLEDWKKLLNDSNFETQLTLKIDEQLDSNSLKSFICPTDIFTWIGQFKSKFKPRLRKEYKNYQQKMKSIMQPYRSRQLMEGILFKARNIK